MRSQTSALALICILACVYRPVLADSSPARLVDGDGSIEELLKVPKGLALGRYKVLCESVILASGATSQFLCYGDVPEKLVSAVVRAGRKATFIPATRDGERVPVYMVLMAIIQITAGEPLILVVPNNGADADRYGQFYTAPQRFNAFSCRIDRVLMVLSEDVRVLYDMKIDERGNITERSVTNVFGAPDVLLGVLDRHLATMEFMPGYIRGKAAPMIYAESFFLSFNADKRSITSERRAR